MYGATTRGKQRLKCTTCNKRFTEKNGFWRMQNIPKTITEALDLSETKIKNDEKNNLVLSYLKEKE